MQQSKLSSRPRFSWDGKSFPWTDSKADQLEYDKDVKKWGAFHDNLQDAHSNKISKINCGIVLQSHLFDRAKDLCDSLDDYIIASKESVQLIFNTVYKKIPCQL